MIHTLAWHNNLHHTHLHEVMGSAKGQTLTWLFMWLQMMTSHGINSECLLDEGLRWPRSVPYLNTCLIVLGESSSKRLGIPCDQFILATKVTYFDLGTFGLHNDINKPFVHMCMLKWWINLNSYKNTSHMGLTLPNSIKASFSVYCMTFLIFS